MKPHHLGPFELLEQIGEGGMGRVYKARDTRLDRLVAIKLLPAAKGEDADARIRFVKEAKAASALNHPNIVTIHETGEHDGQTFIAMELVEGTQLGELISAKKLRMRDALHIATQVADAVAAAHKIGIVHRDLKPANIMVNAQGRAKVLDFGLAKFMASAPTADDETTQKVDTALTERGMILGSVPYMSPEQAEGKPVDARSDIFSFGAVLYEMVTGQRAFRGESRASTLAAVVERDPPSAGTITKDVAPDLERLIARCLRKDVHRRSQSMADVKLALDELHAAPSGTNQTPALGAMRRFLPDVRARLAAGVALAAVILTGLYFWSRDPVTPATSGRTSVVALPAQVFGAQELGFLTDAIPSTLSTQLGQVEGLDTKVPPTSIEFETIHRNLGTVADLYGVTRCIVSSITATDQDHFVLNVQVVEPRSGDIKWGQRYEGPRGSYLELARQAADGIRQSLSPAASSLTTGIGATANSEAELALREGTYFLNKYNNRHEPGHFDVAFTALQRAIKLDPRLADAVGQMALLHRLKWEANAMSTEEAIPEIERWANQALAITTRCSRAWSALFWAEIMRPSADWRKLLDYGLKAVASGPQDSLAHTTLGAAFTRSSNELSLPAFLESRRLDPLYLYASFNAASSLMRLGRPAEALALADEALRVEPSLPYGVDVKSLSLLRLGRTHDFVEWVQQHPKVFEGRLLPQFVLAAERGETEKADAALRNVVTLGSSAQTSTNQRTTLVSALIPLLIEQGKKDLALELLSRSADLGDVPPYDWLMFEPQFAVVRNDPRFKATEVRSRARFEELRTILAEARARGEMPAYLDAPLAKLIGTLGTAR